MNAAHTRRESAFSSASGYLAACAGILLLLGTFYLMKRMAESSEGLYFLLGAVVLGLAGLLCLGGLYMLQPNESAILTLFGKYIGTDRSEGLRWAFPFYVKRRLSLRARNFNAPTLKVNDKRGNPVEISAAVVWRVRDTAQAVFEVDDFERYVSIQAEAALRHLASQYAYDEGEDLAAGEMTLRGGAAEVASALRVELTERFEAAGVETVDAKLTHLAYAPEIAQVMLRDRKSVV